MQRPTSTPSKFLAWQTPRNRRQLRHQTNAAINILTKTEASAIDLIRKLSQQTEAAFARAEIAEIETANLRTKYAGEQARAGPGGRKKLIKGTIVNWKFLEKMEMEKREKEEAVVARAKAKAKRACAREGKRSAAAWPLKVVPKTKVYSERPSNI